MAIRGDDPLKIMQRAGHEDFATTQGYIREAEAVRAGFGDVFPPLVWGPEPGGNVPGIVPEGGLKPVSDRNHSGNGVEAPGIEPGSARRPAYLRSRA